MVRNLTLRDIKFLRAVRDISGNPEAYERTEMGEAPANKRSITLATDLDKKEVGYRLGGNHSRGLEEGDEPLIKTFEPEVVEELNRFGPRSAELTEHGVELLSEIEESGVVGGGDSTDEPETIKQLRARVAELEGGSGGDRADDEIAARLETIETQLGSLEQQLQSLKQSEWGAIDEQYHENLEKTMSRLPAIYHLLTTVFGLDIDHASEEGPYDEATISQLRASVSEVLEEESVQDSGSGQPQSEEGSHGAVTNEKPPEPSSFSEGEGSDSPH